MSTNRSVGLFWALKETPSARCASDGCRARPAAQPWLDAGSKEGAATVTAGTGVVEVTAGSEAAAGNVVLPEGAVPEVHATTPAAVIASNTTTVGPHPRLT